MAITKEEFEQQNAHLLGPGFSASPCECGESNCQGWRMNPNPAQAASAMMQAAGVPGDLQSLLSEFVSGPVPCKSFSEMTPEERQRVRDWVLEDPKIQEERMLEQARQCGEQRAMRREQAFLDALLRK